MEEHLDEIILDITKKTGKSNQEIEKLVNEKVNKFSGLLTRQGAIFMLQKEFGLKKDYLKEIKINELQEGMKDFEIKGTIKTIYPLKEFEKNGKTGKILSFLLEDETGVIRVTLWNEQINKYDLTTGSKIRIGNGFVTNYNERKQLSLGYNGEIEIIEKQLETFCKIGDLSAGSNNVNVVGRLLRKFPCKEFNTEKKGKVCNFQFGDETAILRATAWNEKSNDLQKIEDGEAIEIKNAYTKQGMYGIELHLGYNTTINISKKELPKTIEILKENIKEKNINELTENENVIIKTKIKEIKKGVLFFNACEKCGKKIIDKICENCGETNETKKAVINIIVEDDTGEINAIFFGKNALEAISLKQEGFEKELSEKSNEKIIEELNEKLKEKKIKLFGYAKENSFSGQTEFNVKEIVVV